VELTDAFIISVDKAYTHLNVQCTTRRSENEVERAAKLEAEGDEGGGGYSGSDRGIPCVDEEETGPVLDPGTVSIGRGISFRKERERNLSSGFLRL